MDVAGNESPPPRSTILGSFLGRGRPRNSSQSHIDVPSLQQTPRELSPSPPGMNHRRQQQPPTTSNALSLGHMLRRRRSAGNIAPATPVQTVPVLPTARATTAPIPPAPVPAPVDAHGGTGSGTHRIRL
ncbi:hypothetical protein B0H12DRAFT_1240292, partial [Mycena haematopus]